MERFAIWCVLLPIYLVLFPIGVILLGWLLAAKMAALQIIVTIGAFDIHFHDWHQLP